MTSRRHHTQYSPLLRELRLRLQFGLLLLAIVVCVGVIGYKLLDRSTWLRALYETTSVLTTLGLPEMPRTPAKQLFTVFLAVGGIGLFFYAVTVLAQLVFTGEFHRALARRKVLQSMNTLKDHFIVCGYGRIGANVVRQLYAQGEPFLVIDRDVAVQTKIAEDGFYGFKGDATDEETLELAGVRRARGLIVTTSSDAENALIVITARQTRPDLTIIARCDQEGNADKLKRAGATRVVTPNVTGSHLIALAATKPHVIDLLDLATGTGTQELEIRQVTVSPGSRASGRTLKELSIDSRFSVVVIGIKHVGQSMQFKPSDDARLTPGDMLILVGNEDRFREFESLIGA